MPTFLEKLAARIAFLHASATFARFTAALRDAQGEQQRALQRALAVVRGGELARELRLDAARTVDDFRRAVPLMTYADLDARIERVRCGETAALFSPRQRVLMFATSSGTTARQKFIPVTPAFVNDYRRGWNTFGLKMLSDHPGAVLRAILQSSGRHDESLSPSGVPCGAITGLLARTQKRIVRRFYVGAPQIARISDARARHYTLMRCGLVRDVAFAITANPATLIQMARIADEESERLIRDVHGGTLCRELVQEGDVRAALERRLRPQPARARELAELRARCGALRPRDYWMLNFVACWTGGSMGHYLRRLAEWYGDIPVRDVGLLASEGRISIPLDDGTPAGVLDVTSGFFEFIPVESVEDAHPPTLTARELEVGRDYAIVLTNTAGLLRYRLDDVVRVHGWIEQAPIIEFLFRAGRVASVAGEKLTENQAVTAVRQVAGDLGLPEFDFLLAPCWADPPYYRLSTSQPLHANFAEQLDAALGMQNFEYQSRRKSNRIGQLQIRALPAPAIAAMDRELIRKRRGSAEQYKRPCLFTQPGADDEALGLAEPREAALSQ